MNDQFEVIEQDFDVDKNKLYLKYRYFSEEIGELDEDIKYFDTEYELEEFITENSELDSDPELLYDEENY
jgi:hypothetical protein